MGVDVESYIQPFDNDANDQLRTSSLEMSSSTSSLQKSRQQAQASVNRKKGKGKGKKGKGKASSRLLETWSPLRKKTFGGDVFSKSKAQTMPGLDSSVIPHDLRTPPLPLPQLRTYRISQEKAMTRLMDRNYTSGDRNTVDRMIDKIMEQERHQVVKEVKHAELVLRVDQWGSVEKVCAKTPLTKPAKLYTPLQLEKCSFGAATDYVKFGLGL